MERSLTNQQFIEKMTEPVSIEELDTMGIW
jgi:hypothetical protein